MYAKITGLGSYLPKKILTNDDLAKIVETSHEWIVERSGIHQRHIASENESVVSMAHLAAQEALQSAKLTPQDLDLIIVATCSAEYVFPSAACLLQEKLGATNAAAFDLGAACAGFVYALTTANQFIVSGGAKHVLVVGSEAMSRTLNWQDRTTCVLFGDGAGAVVLSQAEEPGILANKLYADGVQKDILYLQSALGSEKPAYLCMQGKEVFRLAVERLANAITEIAAVANIDIAEIDWIVPHQANSRIIKMIASKLKLSLDKIIVTVDQHANTSSASIPLALHEAVKQGKIKSGQTILFEAFGGGLTWGSVLLRF